MTRLESRARLAPATWLGLLAALVALLFAPTLVSAAATFEVVPMDDPGEGFFDETPVDPIPGNDGTTLGEQRLNAFQAAADLWGEVIESAVKIPIQASMDPLFCTESEATLGAAGPNTVFRDFPSAVRPETWHTVSLANSLAGEDLTGSGEANMQAVFNSSLNGDPDCLDGLEWWYGDPAERPGGTLPFVTVVQHEIAHGLGFTSFYDRTTGAKLKGFDDVYMVNLEDHSEGKPWPVLTNAERLASGEDEGDLHWTGQNVVDASGALDAGRHPSGHVRMYAPETFATGSSVTHFDTILSPDELMEPFLSPTSTEFLTTELLRDIGYQVPGSVGVCEPTLTALCLDDLPGDRRFRVEVDFFTAQGEGSSGVAENVALGSLGINQSGLIYFFDPSNAEILVKVLNGCPINGHYWVFYAATTNVGFDLLITDTSTGRTFLRQNPDQTIASPVADVEAFPCD